MFTAAKGVNNLAWLVDNNKKQLDGEVKTVLDTFDFRAKFEAFGFDAVRIDGNDVEQLYDVLTKAPGDKPLCVVLDTVKGKGVPEVEETANNHSMDVPEETWDRWLSGVKAELEALEQEEA